MFVAASLQLVQDLSELRHRAAAACVSVKVGKKPSSQMEVIYVRVELSHFSGGLLARVERRDDRRPAPDDCSGREERREEIAEANATFVLVARQDPQASEASSL